MDIRLVQWIFRGLGLLLLLGVLFVGGVGFWLYQRTATFLDTAVPATGEVIELRESRGSEGGTTWTPVFTWTDAAGDSHRDSAGYSSSPASHEVGDAIELFYDPADPTDVRVDGFFSLWGFPAILGFLASLQAVFAIALGLVVPWVLGRFGRPAAGAVTQTDPDAMPAWNPPEQR